ncbi:MAG: YdbC family protein [Bacillota bacterium]
MSAYDDDRDVTFDILEEIGIISTIDTGWAKELNLVRWNGGVAKYDIREWDPTHTRMSRGITLKEEEMRRILDLMKKRRSNARSRSRADDFDPVVTAADGDGTAAAAEA